MVALSQAAPHSQCWDSAKPCHFLLASTLPSSQNLECPSQTGSSVILKPAHPNPVSQVAGQLELFRPAKFKAKYHPTLFSISKCQRIGF